MSASPRLLQRFRRNTAGAIAVEFALVIPFFLSIVFSTIEAGWLMVQTIMLDHALDKTVRDLRIGLIANPTPEKIRTAVCKKAIVLIDCNAALALEFIPITADADYPSDQTKCINRSSAIAPTLAFNPGARAQTVFVRACFVVNPITPLMGAGMGLPVDERGEHRLMAKSAFVNEPE